MLIKQEHSLKTQVSGCADLVKLSILLVRY